MRSFPPLHAEWDPRVGVGTVPALLLAALATWRAIEVADRLGWARLLLTVYVAGLAWMLALAFVDGSDGVGVILDDPYEYLGTARATHDFPATLQTWSTASRSRRGPSIGRLMWRAIRRVRWGSSWFSGGWGWAAAGRPGWS